MSVMHGQCLCGACRLTARPGTEAGVCHCGLCRRWSGGMFIVVECSAPVEFNEDAPIGVYHASEWGERVFCRTCGSSMLWRSVDGAFQALSVQVFDEPAAFPLTTEIFIDCKPASYALAGQHATMTEAEFMAAHAPQQES